jgi:hypothetical protein
MRLHSLCVHAIAFLLAAPLAGHAAMIVSSQSASVQVQYTGPIPSSQSYGWAQSAASVGAFSRSVTVTADATGALLDGSTPLAIPLPSLETFGQAGQDSLAATGQISFSGSAHALAPGPIAGEYSVAALSVLDLSFTLTQTTDFVLRVAGFTSDPSEGVYANVLLSRDVPGPGAGDAIFGIESLDYGLGFLLTGLACGGAGTGCIYLAGQPPEPGYFELGTPVPMQLGPGDYRFQAQVASVAYSGFGGLDLSTELLAIPEPGTALLLAVGLAGLCRPRYVRR